MDDFSQSVMVALIPTTTDWCHIDLPHLTLVYAGEKQKLSPTVFNDLAKTASLISLKYPPVILKVDGVDVFGEEDKVDVLRLEPTPDLLAMRSKLVMYNASQYTDYKPHATVGPEGSASAPLPMYLEFDQILVEWGDESVIFWLNKENQRT